MRGWSMHVSHSLKELQDLGDRRRYEYWTFQDVRVFSRPPVRGHRVRFCGRYSHANRRAAIVPS